MSAIQDATQPAPRTRPPRLSPEINEFLHMLDALEGQLGDKDSKTAGSNR